MRQLLTILLWTATLAAAQDLATAVQSPYALARYVEAHNDFHWKQMAEALKITNEDTCLPPCERAYPGHIPCTAHVIDITSPRQAVVILTHQGSYCQVLLRYQSVNPGRWLLTGSYSPFAKHFPLEQSVRNLGSRPFLVSTSEGTAGSDVGTALELWFDLAREGFEPAARFTRKGWYSGMPYGIGRNTSGRILSTSSAPGKDDCRCLSGSFLRPAR